MGLQKTITSDYGADATYWNIGSYQEDFKGKGAQVTLYGYMNKEMRDAGKQPLSAANIQFTGEKYIVNATREQIYELIKLLPEYADAVDC